MPFTIRCSSFAIRRSSVYHSPLAPWPVTYQRSLFALYGLGVNLYLPPFTGQLFLFALSQSTSSRSLPVDLLRSPFRVRHSQFSLYSLSFTLYQSTLSNRHSSFTGRHSFFTVLPFPFTIPFSPFARHHSPFAIRPSPSSFLSGL